MHENDVLIELEIGEIEELEGKIAPEGMWNMANP